MDNKRENTAQNSSQNVEARSRAISEKGIRTGADFANLMSALLSDIICGRVTPEVGNAACNAGGKLLKVVEMQYKFGERVNNGNERRLTLADNPFIAE